MILTKNRLGPAPATRLDQLLIWARNSHWKDPILHVLEWFSWCNPLLARLGRQHFLSEWMVTNMNQAKLCSVERHTKCRHIPIKGSQWRVTHQWRRSSRQAMYLPCRICTSDFTQTLAYPDSLYILCFWKGYVKSFHRKLPIFCKQAAHILCE